MNPVILGDGVLGKELKTQTGWDYISRRKDGFDALNPNFQHLISQEHGVIFYPKYDVVINCIANTNSYSDDLQSHLDINYKFVIALTVFCKEWKIKLVHISTEFVYANNKKNAFDWSLAKESDLPLPSNNHYAKTKLLADQYISLMSDKYLICRGLHKSNDFSPSQVWDIKTCGDKVKHIAPLIIKLINKNATGIFNVGTGYKSYSDLYPKGEIIKPPSYVPLDTSMCLDKLNYFLK